MDRNFANQLNAPLSTSRLVLEPRMAGHADKLFLLMQAEEIYRWISSEPPQSKNQLTDLWAKRETRLSPTGDEAWLNWAVRRISDDRYVGVLDACVDTGKIATNVGYLFFPEFWGQGYASESVLAMTEHLAAQGVSKMIATVTLGNDPSYKILERAGFKRIRIIPDNDTIRGIKYDDIEFIRSENQ